MNVGMASMLSASMGGNPEVEHQRQQAQHAGESDCSTDEDLPAAELLRRDSPVAEPITEATPVSTVRVIAACVPNPACCKTLGA